MTIHNVSPQSAWHADVDGFLTLPAVQPGAYLAHEIDAMPYQLTVRVSGFEGLPELWISRLEQKLTAFFFQPPARLNGIITLYCDLVGDAGQQARRCQLFLFSLRALVSPALNFSMEFEYHI